MATEAKSLDERKQKTHPATSIILPAYNESGNLTPIVREITDVFNDHPEYSPYEIVIVDDGSTDESQSTIRHLSGLYSPVKGVHLARNYGQSAAITAGINEATGNVIVPMDADGQNDPKDIPRLLDSLDGYDCVSGWRKDRRDPWHKRYPSMIQTVLAKQIGPDIHDYGCTLKAYNAEAIQDIQILGEGHRYIPAKLHKNGYSVGEIPVNHRPREHGTSRYGAGRLIRGFVDLLYYYFDVHFSTRPMHILGATGFLFIVAGGMIGVVSVIQKYGFGVDLAPKVPRLVLLSLLIITGIQLVAFGFIAEMITRLQYKDTEPYRVIERVN